jgi:purine-binding chemotaxis protein CheW
MKDSEAMQQGMSGPDWQEINRRIQAAGKAIERVGAPDPAMVRGILRERARELARETEKAPAGESIEVVEFLLSYEKYGIEASYVRELAPLKELTPVPCTPAFVLGIGNVRGRIISVIDIKKFFDLPEKGLTDLNKLIILRLGQMEFGVLADVISGVRTVYVDELQAAPPTFTGPRLEYLRGITKERVAILDAVRLLSDKQIIVHEEVQ